MTGRTVENNFLENEINPINHGGHMAPLSKHSSISPDPLTRRIYGLVTFSFYVLGLTYPFFGHIGPVDQKLWTIRQGPVTPKNTKNVKFTMFILPFSCLIPYTVLILLIFQ